MRVDERKSVKNNTVIIYTTPTCTYCKMAKDFFKAQGVSYSERDVVSDLEARRVMIDKSGQMGVPVIEVNGEIVVGFNKEKLSTLLGLA